MARRARIVFPGMPHHVVQRGNRRGTVFFSDEDRRTYLRWLREYCGKHNVQVLAYCLMDNHVHLVAVPSTPSALELALRPLHTRYALRVNAVREWKGHLWQGRYFSAVLDESYLWTAIRYVELNPVRAGMVARAEDHPWSSAPAHCRGRSDPVLTSDPGWVAELSSVSDWSAWLAQDEPAARLDVIRTRTQSRTPCGSDAFLEALERQAGVPLGPRPIGRPKTKVGTHTTFDPATLELDGR